MNGWAFSNLLDSCFISTPSLVIARRDTLIDVGGFDESVKLGADYDCWLRLTAKYPIASAPGAWISYRKHPRQMSSHFGARGLAHVVTIKRALELVRTRAVATENKPEEIDAEAQMRRAYLTALHWAYNAESYGMVRQLGYAALRDGMFDRSFLMRWFSSYLPRWVLGPLRRRLSSE